MSRVTIKELRLRNYRAFADARLVLDDITFLVGRNGAGKSTLMDGFAFVSEALTDSLGTALERRGNLTGLMTRRSRRAASSGVSVAICLQDEDDSPVLYGFEIRPSGRGSSYVVESEILRDRKGMYFMRSKDYSSDERVQLPRIPVDAGTLVFPLLAGTNAASNAILEALRLISVHQLSPLAIRSEPNIGSESRLSREGRNAGDILKHLKSDDRHWIDVHLAEAVSGIRGVRATARAGRRVIVFEQEGDDGQTNKFDASMMSDGTLRSLGVLLALRQSPRPSVVLLDEIEDSLHPLAHGVLLDAIDAVSGEFPVVVSTHSPEILDHPAASGQRIRVIQWDQGSSRIYRLKDTVRGDLAPPLTVGRLLRANALWTDDEPSTAAAGDDFFEP